MANTKISALTAITGANLAASDLAVVVDVSDTSMAASGTTKKTTVTDLATAIATAGSLATSAAVAAGYQPLDSDLTAIAALTTTSYGRAFLALADNAAARTAIGFYETGIVAGDTMVWSSINSRFEPATVLEPSAYIQSFLPAEDAATARTTLGLGTAAVTATTAYATAAQGTTADAAMPKIQTVNAQTGTTYTLVAGDAAQLVTLANAGATTLTLPQDSDATIAVGVYIDLLQLGAGQVTVAAGTGATLRTSGLTAKARAQYSRLVVQKISANTWSLAGDLAAS